MTLDVQLENNSPPSSGRLGKSLIRNYLDHPVFCITYRDPLLFERAQASDYPESATREAIGWVDHDAEEFVRIIWDRSIKKLPG